ncbi:Up-regulated during septation-domain-containing protein [Calycina marina]|uniref:Up-regulated during septation-domain-containing protein n=1 Tax=Calycina marina TaxID=1763456 RepID=A0A9P7Z1Q1_9HELO|nr:Up-regulated during septation-domain-containing protein [Calycina marina]
MRLGSPLTSPTQKHVDGINGQTVLEGYREELMNSFASQMARYNPLNVQRPQSSMLLNVNDPIQVHLLVETALGDSSEYEVLSPEEVDNLKKQCQSLTQRIKQTQQNLAIQSKYRDASISMSKLYNPSDKKESRKRSVLSHHKSDSVKEADIERMRCEERCEELALELWSLEKRLIEPQKRLLKHTAGVLQMTHKGPEKVTNGQGVQQNGIPGSPESMYTYHNSKNSLGPSLDDDLFDDRSLYRDADKLETYGETPKRNGFEPHPLSLPSKTQGREQMQMAKTEKKLEDLNGKLREAIIRANPDREQTLGQIPTSKVSNGRSMDANETLTSHLDFLEKGIDAEFDRQMEEAERRQEESDAAMEETIEDMNREIRGILLSYDPNRPELPELTGTGLQNQLLYFQESVRVIEAELAHSHDYSSIKAINNDTGQMETILMGLWDIIQSGYGEIRKQKQERRINRSANGLPDDDESDDDGGDSDETYSLQAFSKKVQWLYGQATKLKDQKKVLQVQIKQQRELNNKSDATKDTEMRQKSEELERTRSLLVRAEADSDRVREQLSEVMEKLNEARQNENLLDQQRSTSESSAVRAAQDESNQRLAIIQKLEGELEELKDDHSIAGAEFKAKLSTAESRIAEMTAQLKAATEEKAQWKDSMVERDVAIEQKEHEMENMKMKLAELQTEVTIARAELDGAYGSRAQRAAEVAANPVIAREIDSLTRNNASLAAEITELKSASASAGQGSKDSDQRIEVLKKELTETIEDYEKMTKANIEWEKERERLEETIDKLRDQREQLEAELSDEKVRWLGMRSPIGMDGPPSEAGRTSTTVLKEEFKKMMRTTRADSAKVVRAEQAERRRLEDELRSLKKSLGPGKSNLGQNLRPA